MAPNPQAQPRDNAVVPPQREPDSKNTAADTGDSGAAVPVAEGEVFENGDDATGDFRQSPFYVPDIPPFRFRMDGSAEDENH